MYRTHACMNTRKFTCMYAHQQGSLEICDLIRQLARRAQTRCVRAIRLQVALFSACVCFWMAVPVA